MPIARATGYRTDRRMGALSGLRCTSASFSVEYGGEPPHYGSWGWCRDVHVYLIGSVGDSRGCLELDGFRRDASYKEERPARTVVQAEARGSGRFAACSQRDAKR